MDSTRDPYLQLLDLTRLFNKGGRFTGSAFGTELSITEALLLNEIAVDPGRMVADLSSIIRLDKSTVSRYLTSLEKRKYISRSTGKQDKRRKQLEILKKGRDFLQILDAQNEAYNRKMGARISDEEREELQKFYKIWADGDDAPIIRLRPKEHEMVLHIRRITYSLGAIGRNWLGTQYSLTIWQVLSELAYGKGQRLSKDLSQELTIPPSTLSQLLSRLEKLKLIQRKQTSEDGRAFALELTASGKKALASIESVAQARFQKAFRTISARQFNRFLEIWKKYIGQPEIGGASDEIVVQARYSLRQIVSTEDMSLLRRTFRSSSKANPKRRSSKDGELDGAVYWGVFREEEILGYLALDTKGEETSVLECAYQKDQESIPYLEKAFSKAISSISSESRVRLPTSLRSDALLRKILNS
jgi:DNA-binding MarR family transcriptional regulator